MSCFLSSALSESAEVLKQVSKARSEITAYISLKTQADFLLYSHDANVGESVELN